jgi:hypothetical protein
MLLPSRPNRGGFARHHEAGRESGVSWRQGLASPKEPGSAQVRPTSAIRADSFHHGGVFVDGRGPPSPAGRNQTARTPQDNRARGSGSGRWRCFDTSTSTFGTQPSTATPPDPAPSLGNALAFRPSRREPAGGAGMDTHDPSLHAVRNNALVVPGDRRETRDLCLSLSDKGSDMDPGSTLRSGRDDTRFDQARLPDRVPQAAAPHGPPRPVPGDHGDPNDPGTCRS